MPFSDFTNPCQNPADIPEKYRQHINLQKLFKADASYVRPAEDPMTMWAQDLLKLNVPIVDPIQQKLTGNEFEKRRIEAKGLSTEAENLVTEAKARVERMILGEEDVA
jgi:hypothetical protein